MGKRSNTDLTGEDLLPQHCAVTVLVCRKRIQSRLLPGGSGARTLNNGNVLPGTVAAEGVLSALRQNFLLVSAAGIQGTSKPTEYVCILDEIGFSPESLAMLTFWSCHTYGLCARRASSATLQVCAAPPTSSVPRQPRSPCCQCLRCL